MTEERRKTRYNVAELNSIVDDLAIRHANLAEEFGPLLKENLTSRPLSGAELGFQQYGVDITAQKANLHTQIHRLAETVASYEQARGAHDEAARLEGLAQHHREFSARGEVLIPPAVFLKRQFVPASTVGDEQRNAAASPSLREDGGGLESGQDAGQFVRNDTGDAAEHDKRWLRAMDAVGDLEGLNKPSIPRYALDHIETTHDPSAPTKGRDL